MNVFIEICFNVLVFCIIIYLLVYDNK